MFEKIVHTTKRSSPYLEDLFLKCNNQIASPYRVCIFLRHSTQLTAPYRASLFCMEREPNNAPL